MAKMPDLPEGWNVPYTTTTEYKVNTQRIIEMILWTGVVFIRTAKGDTADPHRVAVAANGFTDLFRKRYSELDDESDGKTE